MEMHLAAFKKSWELDRTLTLDLLTSLSESDLFWSPGPALGQFWKQFRHIGRVQEDYIEALRTRKINFNCENKNYKGGPSRNGLADYLNQVDECLWKAVGTLDAQASIDWFGETVHIDEHLKRMASHEVLHHGQWIVYCQLLNKPFPESWSVWGL